MGTKCISPAFGVIGSCCRRMKEKTRMWISFGDNEHFNDYMGIDVDMKDDGNHSGIMTNEEIRLMIERNQQTSGGVNEYKILKNSGEEDDGCQSGSGKCKEVVDKEILAIKQEVNNTIEFDEDDDEKEQLKVNIMIGKDNKEEDNRHDDLLMPIIEKDSPITKESIEKLKQEILMDTPEDDDDNNS